MGIHARRAGAGGGAGPCRRPWAARSRCAAASPGMG